MHLSTRVFVAAASACGAAWLVKTALIAANGGTRTGGGLIGVLWAVGMLCLLVAAASGAVAVLRSRPAWQRALGGLVAVPLLFTLVNVVDGLVKAVHPGTGWFRDELSLVLVGALMAGIALAVVTRASERRVSPDAR